MWRHVVVCALLLLAGCNVPADDATPTESAVTAAPIPADETLAPGITRDGVVAPVALADAHAEALANRSYTLHANRSVKYANGTLRENLTLDLRLTANRSYLVDAATTGPEAPVFLGIPPANATFWSNGSTYARRLTRDGATTYNTFQPVEGAGTWQYWARTVPFGGERASPWAFLRRTFSAVPTAVVGIRTVDSTRQYHIAGESARGPLESGIENPKNVNLTAVVTEEGIVRSLSLSYVGTVDERRVVVTRSFSYREIGATTAPRPPWFGQALDG